jgi:hypothetical protein
MIISSLRHVSPTRSFRVVFAFALIAVCAFASGCGPAKAHPTPTPKHTSSPASKITKGCNEKVKSGCGQKPPVTPKPATPKPIPSGVNLPPGFPNNVPNGTYDISYCSYGTCRDGGHFPASAIATTIACNNGGGTTCVFKVTKPFNGVSFVGNATTTSCSPGSPCGVNDTTWTVTKVR